MKALPNHLLLSASANLIRKSIYTLIYSLVLIVLIFIDCKAQGIPVFAAQAKLIKPQLYNPYTAVRCTVQDKTGNIWFGTTGAGVYRYDGKTFTNFTEKDGLLNKTVFSIIEDKSGNIWVATDDGAYRYNGKKFSHFPILGMDEINYNFFHEAYLFRGAVKAKQNRNPIFCMLADKVGNIWFGSGKYGLCRYNGQSFTNINYVNENWRMIPKDSVISDDEYYKQAIQSLYEDAGGNILFSSISYGLFKYNGKTITKMKTDKAIKGGVFFMTGDKEDKIWFAANGNGVYSYDGKSIENLTKKDGLCMAMVTCILADKKGNLWFGTTYADELGKTKGCVSRYDGKTITQFPLDGLENTSIWNIFEDRSGNIWFGARNLSLYHYDGHSFTDFTEKPAKQ